MTEPDVSVIVPVPEDASALPDTIVSALSSSGVSVEVIVVAGSLAPKTGSAARALCSDPRTLLLTSDVPTGPLEARRRGLEAARGRWVTFLDPGHELTHDGLACAVRCAESHGAKLAMPSSGGDRLVPDGSVVHAVFSEGAAPLSLSGAVARRDLAACAFDDLPCASVPRESGIVALFALCYEAPGLSLCSDPVVAPVAAPSRSRFPLEQFRSGCLASQAAGAVGRVISRKNDWDCHRSDYQALVLRLLEPLVAPFPGNVPPESRGAAFEALAEAWPAPELAAAVAHWKLGAGADDGLTALLEAASKARLTSGPESGRVSSVALLSPSGCDPASFELERQVESCALLGVEASVLADAGLPVPDAPAAALPAWKVGDSYLPRARALVRAVREHGVDALAAPLTGSPTLALDLLCARLAGVPTVLLAPQGAASLLGTPSCPEGPTAPELLRVAQAAEVIGCPTPRNARFWSYAAPEAAVVPVEPGEGAQEYWSRLFDALEESPDLDFLPPRASVFSTEAAAVARAFRPSEPTSPAAAAERIRELEEQAALLEARLAAAHNEARSLRRQLVEAGMLPAGAPFAPDRPSEDWD